MNPLLITDIRGGLNNEDPAFALPEDQVVLCENMDLTRSTLGGRRFGHAAVTVSGFNDEVVFLHRGLISADETEAQLWAVSVSGTTVSWHRKTDSWQSGSGPATSGEDLDVAQGKYGIRAVNLHGKIFFAYPNNDDVDRLRVWDNGTHRPTGLLESNPTTVTDTGAGSYTTARYFRLREIKKSGATIQLRSEPSDSVLFTPSGTGASARVDEPTAVNALMTHWEVEESLDDVDFYKIGEMAFGDGQYDDSLTPAQVTASTVSPDIGDYATLHNPKFLSVDQDRLLLAGSWEQAALGSRIAWTPVGGAPGVGNDERFEEDTDPYLDLDGYDGGALTDFAGPIGGYHYAFKRKRIYKIIRTYARAQAYQALPLTDAFGAITGSVVKGLDESGGPCLYFLDPDVGPSRIGSRGVERCGADIHGTWTTLNKDANLFCVPLFYPDQMLVSWHVAEAGSEVPTLRIKLHVQEQTGGRLGARRGWSTDTGPYMAVLSAMLFSDNVEANTARSLTLTPLYGTAISAAKIIQQTTAATDNSVPYQARVRTKPYLPGGLLAGFSVRKLSVLAEASEADLTVSLIRDYGVETREAALSLRPSSADETHVFVDSEAANLAELKAVQVEYGDSGPATADWVVEAIALQPEDGQEQ